MATVEDYWLVVCVCEGGRERERERGGRDGGREGGEKERERREGWRGRDLGSCMFVYVREREKERGGGE